MNSNLPGTIIQKLLMTGDQPDNMVNSPGIFRTRTIIPFSLLPLKVFLHYNFF